MNDKVCFPTSTSSILFLFPVAILPLSTLSSPSSCYSCAEHSLGLKWCQSSVTPAIWRHPRLSAPLEAVGWVMQPCTMRHEPSSTWRRWGISWLLPLPSIPGWLKSAWLILHPSWAELGSLWPSEGSQHLLPVPAGLPLSHLPMVSEENPPDSWAMRVARAELWVSFPHSWACFLINSVKKPQKCGRGWKWPSWNSIIGFGEGKPVSKENSWDACF